MSVWRNTRRVRDTGRIRPISNDESAWQASELGNLNFAMA